MSRTLTVAFTLTLLATLALSPAAGATTVQETRIFYMDNTGTACGADANFVLGASARTGGPNCGYVGGLPFGEVFAQSGDTAFGTKSYISGAAGLPVTVDASKDVAGQVRIIHSGGTTGVGQVRIDVELRGLNATTNKTVSLGSASVTRTLMGDLAGVTIPYSINTPDALQGVTFSKLTLDVNVRGVHANTGYTSTQGDSNFTLPILVEQAPQP